MTTLDFRAAMDGRPARELAKRRPYRQFSYVPTLDGFDVVCDLTGHTVIAGRPSARSANGIAQSLNEAARHGTLARALGCVEDCAEVGTLRTTSAGT